MIRVPFVKMHGAGNDFVVIDALDGDRFDYPRHAAHIADRRFGVGCDQMLVIRPSDRADVQMRIFNRDGSEVEMCGNGIRCLLRYLLDHGKLSGDEAVVETPAGLVRPRRVGDRIRVDMGPPVLDGPAIPVGLEGRVVDRPFSVDGHALRLTAVSMGNPHAVFFVDDPDRFPVAELGPRIENHPLFPRRTNVEFARVDGRDAIALRVWERGAGETLACGTGACGTMVAAALNGWVDSEVQVRLPGGTLTVAWDGDSSHSVFMTGPAVEVFRGEIGLPG